MLSAIRRRAAKAYEGLLRREIDGAPTHVAIIQDGNRRYAQAHGGSASEGHRQGADTTERVLEWCEELGIEELTLYAFSTENFNRPPEEREAIFDLICEKLYQNTDAEEVHDNEVRIRALGEVAKLPPRVQEAVAYAEEQTRDYDRFRLNIALAYGGRNELLRAARDVASAVEAGEFDPEDIDVSTVEDRIYDRAVRDVDLIIRTGGDERTSNFLPWHANGNEAAVFFCAPNWPEFSKIDFLRAIRTYQAREESWRRSRSERAVALVRAVARVELDEAKAVAQRLADYLPKDGDDVVDELDVEPAD